MTTLIPATETCATSNPESEQLPPILPALDSLEVYSAMMPEQIMACKREAQRFKEVLSSNPFCAERAREEGPTYWERLVQLQGKNIAI
jgi:hypothetical protein